MNIVGIEALSFGVTDTQEAARFLNDFGLREGRSDVAGAALYVTQDQSRLYVYDAQDASLPAAIEEGSTLREVVWGVADAASLSELALRLADQPGFTQGTDFVQCLDPNGLSIRFVPSQVQPVTLPVSGINQYGDIQRVNEASPVYEQAEPVRVGHVVFFTPDLATVQAFYIDKLGFHLSDAYNNRGAFLRCKAEGHHHDLFLLKLPNKPVGLNHVAFVVRDIHEVIGGGIAMNRKKWSTFIGPGRHPISSAYFWYVNSPFGGAFEYYTNDDYLTEAWTPRFYDYQVSLFTEWAIEGGIDDDTRRQLK